MTRRCGDRVKSAVRIGKRCRSAVGVGNTGEISAGIAHSGPAAGVVVDIEQISAAVIRKIEVFACRCGDAGDVTDAVKSAVGVNYAYEVAVGVVNFTQIAVCVENKLGAGFIRQLVVAVSNAGDLFKGKSQTVFVHTLSVAGLDYVVLCTVAVGVNEFDRRTIIDGFKSLS